MNDKKNHSMLDWFRNLRRNNTLAVTIDSVTSGAGVATESTLGDVKTSLQIIDDWDSQDAAKTVGITTIVKKTGANIGVDGAAYASGDLIGDQSPITLAAARYSGGSGIIYSVTIKDLSKQNAALKIVIFDSNPSNTTFTDNAALDINDADIDKIIGWIDVASSDYISFSDNSVATVKGINLPFVASGSVNLYFCIISNGTPTYVADELSVAFGISQD